MNELPYQDIIKNLVDNSLLHLYISVAETSRLVPVYKRNEILVRHLKPMLKDSRYRRIKNELRRLLSTGRSAKGDLEAQLINVRELAHRVELDATGAQKLFKLLETLRYEQGLNSRIVNESEKRIPGFIYMLRDHIDNGFNEAGEQVAPMSLFLESDKMSGLVETIEKTRLFSTEIKQNDEDEKQGHLLLHPSISSVAVT
ncbi:Protein of unknown function (DUF2913) [Shewanella psychrophila]|uniref:DUF2913 family protein n=1 Tax=Shewanella psychrophila TaxID=225848 RepID=A0A1S6HSX4_9GAMM|nr:DUF2913 family protein [Shewanella psychrophila]AQS38650.1 Protein of unknown function (DUF2913) [Shewanella psychrophila]